MSIKFNDYKKLELQDLANLVCEYKNETKALVLEVSRLLKQIPFIDFDDNSNTFYFKVNHKWKKIK